MQVNEAIEQMIHGNSVDSVVEEFKFQTGKPNLTLSFNTPTKSRVVIADLDTKRTQCGDTGDFKSALSVFARDVKKFLELRGWRPVGKPFFCNNSFVWQYEDDPGKEDKFTPRKQGVKEPLFDLKARRAAAAIRKKSSASMRDLPIRPKRVRPPERASRKSFLQRVLGN